MNTFKITMTAIGIFIFIAVLGFTAHGVGLVNLKFWGPKYEEAKREIFEETQSFVHGKITHINRLRLEYDSTDSPTRKNALRTMILQEASVLEHENLPPNLAAFLSGLESNIGGIE